MTILLCCILAAVVGVGSQVPQAPIFRRLRRPFRIFAGLAFSICLLFGSLVMAHAASPHKCPYHSNTLGCTHVTDPGDKHAPGEQSDNQKKKQKSNGDWMDIVGCGCFWDCLMNGSF